MARRRAKRAKCKKDAYARDMGRGIALIDSGAEVSVVHAPMVPGSCVVKPSGVNLTAAFGKEDSESSPKCQPARVVSPARPASSDAVGPVGE